MLCAGVTALMMAQSLYERCSWFPSVLREKKSCRRGCCDLLRFCRTRTHILDFPPGSPCVHEAVKLLDELLADGGCARAVSCRCRESLQDSFSLAAALSSAFLPRCHEEECRPRGASRCRLLRGLFFQMDLMRHWHKMTTVGPWIQDFLEVGLCCWFGFPAAGLVPVLQGAPGGVVRGVCRYNAQTQQSTGGSGSEVRGAQSCCRPIYRISVRSGEEGRRRLIGGRSANRPQTETRSPLLVPARRPLLGSAAEEFSEEDLETHQLYLSAIETRLSGLERRAQDVTKRLERANLELEAIKQRQRRPEDPRGRADLFSGDRTCGRSVGGFTAVRSDGAERAAGMYSAEPEEGLCRRKDPERRGARDHPAGGGSVHPREDVRRGLSSCQRHVDVLLQQITRQN
ncbi:unnamed protein product [Ranitomeya imitator]|uniref:Uncharacterized protein n=1 Tax=Ranitomeya imitator TaxID=111125 RepID=A0ABN9LWG0_9NEOB|nr:unnamed protein product [Ranitomeya imitator]